MRKISGLIIGMFILIIFGNSLISGLVCCEKLKDGGAWCQDATAINECDSKYTHWDKFCSVTPECTGTCIETTGKCAENVPQTKCKEDKGNWNQSEANEIGACQEICCLLGQEAWYINPIECQAIFTSYGYNGEMIRGISRDECYARSTAVVIGACVISTSAERNCTITTEEECSNAHLSELKSRLANPDLVTEPDLDFYENRLCTAEVNNMLISDCAPTNYSICKENKIYFTDTCGNTANVYDLSKTYVRGNITRENYWTFMKDYFDPTICNVSEIGSSTCGNCDTGTNTVCQSYKDSNLNQPSRMSNPSGLVCGDLSCEVDLNGDGDTRDPGEVKNHLESWCGEINTGNNGAKTSGIMIIHRNLTTGQIFKKDIDALKNTSKYNLPGSRYYKLVCSYGKVIVEECGDYRSSVCIEGTNDIGETSAVCEYNPWINCLAISNRTVCEDNTSLCKWIPGYRWDNSSISEENRKQYQGSCVPLIAKGLNFSKTQSAGLCQMSTVREYTLFETSIWTTREALIEDKEDVYHWPTKHLANRCFDKCYALPFYAIEFNQTVYRNGTVEEKKYPEELNCRDVQHSQIVICSDYQILTEFYDESEWNLESGVGDYHLSDRRGQYCHKDGTGNEDQWLTGGVVGSNYDCTRLGGSEAMDERKERDYPIYLTNDEWLRGITERARSIADCGYKPSINGDYSDPETERITAIFQKMSQKGNVKKNITVEQTIWQGGRYIRGDLTPYETELNLVANEAEGASNCASVNGVCMVADYCIDEYENSEVACPGGTVCCTMDIE